MKTASILLAMIGLASASRCRLSPSPSPSPVSSISSVSSASSVSSFSIYSSPSSSLPAPSSSSAAPVVTACGPDTSITDFSKDLTTADWGLLFDPGSYVQGQVYTCSTGPGASGPITNGCIVYDVPDAPYTTYFEIAYTAHGLTVGQAYTFSLQYSDSRDRSDAPYQFSTTAFSGAGDNSFFFVQSAGTWQTVSFQFTARNVDEYVFISNTVLNGEVINFGNFNLYQNCPTTGGN